MKKYFIIAIIVLIAAAIFINTDKPVVKKECCADSLAFKCDSTKDTIGLIDSNTVKIDSVGSY